MNTRSKNQDINNGLKQHRKHRNYKSYDNPNKIEIVSSPSFTHNKPNNSSTPLQPVNKKLNYEQNENEDVEILEEVKKSDFINTLVWIKKINNIKDAVDEYSTKWIHHSKLANTFNGRVANAEYCFKNSAAWSNEIQVLNWNEFVVIEFFNNTDAAKLIFQLKIDKIIFTTSTIYTSIFIFYKINIDESPDFLTIIKDKILLLSKSINVNYNNKSKFLVLSFQNFSDLQIISTFNITIGNFIYKPILSKHSTKTLEDLLVLAHFNEDIDDSTKKEIMVEYNKQYEKMCWFTPNKKRYAFVYTLHVDSIIGKTIKTKIKENIYTVVFEKSVNTPFIYNYQIIDKFAAINLRLNNVEGKNNKNENDISKLSKEVDTLVKLQKEFFEKYHVAK